MSENEMPNQNSECSEQHVDYLRRAAEACERGDSVLGMHLYLTAYEKAAADPEIPDGMALAGLREAWQLACELKERSLAEYIFEKLEPYLTGDEIAACANKLQTLALDRLEEYGFSREELEEMAEMISADFVGGDASVVKVESISIPNAAMFGVPAPSAGNEPASQAESADAPPAPADDDAQGEAGEAEARTPGMTLANIEDFNPYDLYRDYSIGKSYHAATNEGSGAAVFTRDKERAEAHERFLAGATGEEDTRAADRRQRGDDAEDGSAGQTAPAGNPANADAQAAQKAADEDAPAQAIAKAGNPGPKRGAGISGREELPTAPSIPPVGQAPLSYRTLAGYDEAVCATRNLGVGLQNDRDFKDFIAMMNAQHGLDRAPALDALLFRAPVIEDANRFMEATLGEIGLPPLRMSMEESMQGMPVLCVTTQGNNRPRMNHAHNHFEAPAILVLEDLDSWYVPEPPEGVEGMAGFMMANISRGAREAVNLIRSAVEDPDVYVLATSTTDGEVDPFFYELLEPLTIIDIEHPTANERAAIWAEIARDHPSMRTISHTDLVRHTSGLSRYEIYMAAREAIEEAYKAGVAQRDYIPISPLNIFEKIAAYQPLESEEYASLEELVMANFQRELEDIDDLLDDPRG